MDDSSCNDVDFIHKLKSPCEKAKLHSKTPYGEELHNKKLITTTIHESHNSENRLVNDLYEHILYQNNVIANLRNKLGVIGNISYDSITFNSKLLKPKTESESSIKVNVCNKHGELVSGDGGTGDTSESCKNMNNLHNH